MANQLARREMFLYSSDSGIDVQELVLFLSIIAGWSFLNPVTFI